MANRKKSILTNRAFGPILCISGCALARPTTAERIRKMTHPFWEALCRPISHAIYPTDSQRSGAVEANPAAQQRADGGSVRRAGWAAMAEVHGRRGSTRSQSAHFVLRDGSARAGCEDARPNLESDARGRRDDRFGQRVSVSSPRTTVLPNALPKSVDPFDIVPSAWRNGRSSKPATTITPDLFELAGTRAAEHWLKIRPTASPNQWCRSTFDNLVAGLGRIPSYADCIAAFERSFKRRIEAAGRPDREAAGVRA